MRLQVFVQGISLTVITGVFDPSGASLVAQTVNNMPAMQETWVRSLSQEDPLEKGMATHSSILAWKEWQSPEQCGSFQEIRLDP